MSFKMTVLPIGHKPGWKLSIGGRCIPVDGLIKLTSKWGTLTYGMRPEGFDGWVYRIAPTVVTLPFTYTPEGEILVGLFLERRPNLSSKPVLCVMGGFVESGESCEKAQRRESDEEGGMETGEAKKVDGVGSVPDRLLYECDVNNGGGVSCYLLRIAYEDLGFPNNTAAHYRILIESSAYHLPKRKPEFTLVFLPWRQAVKESPDALARAAIAQLLSEVLP